MKLVITHIVNKLFVRPKVTTLIVKPFDTGVGAPKLSLIEAIGDLLVGSGAGSMGKLAAGDEGTVPVRRAAAPLGIAWENPQGGGGQQMLNNSISDLVAGDVVIFDTSADQAVKTTTIAQDVRVAGVAGESIGASASGTIITVPGTVVTINCDTAAVARGDFLVSSATAKKATSIGPLKTPAAFAIALTAKAAGSAGTVTAMLYQGFNVRAAAGSSGWAVGGWNGTTVYNDAQKFNIAAGTWASVAGAALPATRRNCGGFGNNTVAGYTLGGLLNGSTQDPNCYRTSFLNETTSALSSANLATTRQELRSGMASTLAGYTVGGLTTAAVSAVDKVTFANETNANLGNALPTARYGVMSLTDGVYGYALGGHNGSAYLGTCERINFSNDSWAANPNGTIFTAVDQGTVNFPASAGYVAVRTSSSYCNKITFATGVASSVSSTMANTHNYASTVCDGVSLAWWSGDSNSPFTMTDSFNRATEVFAADATAVMSVGKTLASFFNYGAF